MEPVNLHAGDSIAWSRDVPAFPAANGWALQYVFNGPASYSIDAVSEAPYRVELAAPDTADWLPGLYRWVALAVKGDLRATVATGLLQVEPNWQTAGPADMRTHAARMIALIESALEKRIPKDQQSYEIDGQRLDRIPVERLRELRLQYQRELMQQRRKGSGLVRNLLVRL
ncbi:hypothetical protein [Pseudomonas sp. RT6P73]